MKRFDRWTHYMHERPERPAYLLIADLIHDAIESGDFQPRDRLPPLRDLAVKLSLNYTTVTRGYAEARKRGLIDSRPGTGSFIRGKVPSIPPRNGSSYEMTMNLPVEPDSPDLVAQIRQGALNLFAHKDLFPLLRYHDFGGNHDDKEAGCRWLGRRLPAVAPERLLVCPGIHSVLVGLLTLLARRGGEICVGSLVYPGLKAIAAQLDITLHALECDGDGPMPRSFENACQTGQIRALYLNPTINNPTTLTLPLRRREKLADVALRYSIPIIEDDAYGMLPSASLPAMAELVPELTWYITGLSKCFGAGLRIAWVHAPTVRQGQHLAGAMRALTVMSSPFTNALATQWINDGTAEKMLLAVREEAVLRQRMAARLLRNYSLQADAEGFHLWLRLPHRQGWNPSDVAVKLRHQGVSAVSSAAFCTDNNPPDALRLCLGGPNSREQCEAMLKNVADMLEYPAWLSTVAL
ncbi:PLP-dependent aminotransferase family protein [Sodalis ligni]|uniref:aminotransferase-like domain-containing protein n=1 Tax=Sodalis ligni TaxID=2697027 RepID=UPI00193FB37A|nr:PLP-dependent aminotransferase family protein [Sodalis ligni]QWA12979.1 PLP-dependent aminotransferase family protein [Sodalis ligni]